MEASPSPVAMVASTTPVAMTASPAAASTTPTEVTDAAGATTYDQTVHYNNPGGGDDVEFKVTVDKAGTITDAAATVKAVHDTSIKMQTQFAADVKEEVVGKKLADLKVDRIGGASLTTGAFQTFLDSLNT